MHKSIALAFLSLATLARAETPSSWQQEVEPFQVAEHTWYVGTAGLSALLIRTSAGAVLLDAGLPGTADAMLARLRKLGVAPADVRLILNSHAHFDHAGAIEALRMATGATVVASAEGKALLERGDFGDIHFGDAYPFPPVTVGRLVQDGATVTLGDFHITAHFTPGHTPGSITWQWRDRIDGRDVSVVFADSVTAPGYQLVNNPHYPRIVDDYRRSFAMLRQLPCDVAVSTHPEVIGLDPAAPEPAARRINPKACRALAEKAEQALDAKVKKERKQARQDAN